MKRNGYTVPGLDWTDAQIADLLRRERGFTDDRIRAYTRKWRERHNAYLRKESS